MSALVISAFPGCGKSTYYKNWSLYSPENKYRQVGKEGIGERILDSDSSNFKWFHDENGVKSDVQVPWFPNNYIEHIKTHMETEDIIFVSSHKEVRDALKENGIPYILIYPDRSLKSMWMERFRVRGNTEEFIKFQNENWDNFIDQMEQDDYPTHVILRHNKESIPYITLTLMKGLQKMMKPSPLV